MSKQNSPRLFDTHCHLQFAAYKDDMRRVVDEDLARGVWMIIVGTQKDTSRAAVELAESYPEGVYTAIGLHPIHLTPIWHDVQELGGGKGFSSRAENFDADFYRSLAKSKKVAAIGEMGLDFFRLNEAAEKSGKTKNEIKQLQQETFNQGIDLAAELDLPLIVHSRAAQKEIQEILQEKKCVHPNLRGVIHSFSDGTWQDAQKYLDLGFYIGLNGIITFQARKSALAAHEELQRVAREIPLDRLLLETDAPYLSPPPHRGERNRPAYTEFVAEHIAHARGISKDKILQITTTNAQKLFKV